MLYALQEYAYHAATPMRFAARLTRDCWNSAANPMANTEFGRNLYAAADLFSNVTRRYGKPQVGHRPCRHRRRHRAGAAGGRVVLALVPADPLRARPLGPAPGRPRPSSSRRC